MKQVGDNSETEPNSPFGAISTQRFPSGLLQMQRPQKSFKPAYFNHRDLFSRGVGKPSKKSKKKIVCFEILSSAMSSKFSHVQNLVNKSLSVSANQIRRTVFKYAFDWMLQLLGTSTQWDNILGSASGLQIGDLSNLSD